MAYKKTYSRKKFSRRSARKPQYTTAGSVTHLAKKAMEGVKFLKSVINVEYKYNDLSVIPTNLDYGGVVGNFHQGITQGLTASTRTGDSIKVTSLDIGLTIYKGSTQAGTVPYRLLILRGHDERLTPPIGSSVLASSGTYQAVNCPRAVDTVRNYSVIKEIKGVISSIAGDKDSVHHHEIYISEPGHVKYGTSVNTAEDGGLYYMFISDGAAATTQPNFAMYARTRFVDN